MKALSPRNQKILRETIRNHIRTGEPVASQTIARGSQLGVSAATIRHAMAELEEAGYLYQPHTSAGRLPTDKGYRCYVDTLMTPSPLRSRDRLALSDGLEIPLEEGGLQQVVRDVARRLASLCGLAAVITTPRFEETSFTHVQLLPLQEHRLLALFVSKSGDVYNRILSLDFTLSPHELDSLQKILNELLCGSHLKEVRATILQALAQDWAYDDHLRRKALLLSKKALCDAVSPELVVEGTINLFQIPEFMDNIQKMRGLVQTLEEKQVLLTLLEISLGTDGVSISIGTENPYKEVNSCSIITSSYGAPGSPWGSLGIVGPTRMDYPRLIPLVEFASRSLDRLIREHQM